MDHELLEAGFRDAVDVLHGPIWGTERTFKFRILDDRLRL